MTAKQQTFTAAGIRHLLAEHEDSELSLAAFAREKGIAPYRLYDARRRSRLQHQNRDLPGREAFAEVRVNDTTLPTSAPLELTLPSGYAIRIGHDFDEVTLRRLLGVLGSC